MRILYTMLLLTLLSCNYEQENKSIGKLPNKIQKLTIDEKIELLGYDYEKDAYFNKILNRKPISIKRKYNTTYIRYEEFEIQVTHINAVPYKSPEYSFINCYDKHGNMIIIESSRGVAKHKVSNSTLDRIKLIAKQSN